MKQRVFKVDGVEMVNGSCDDAISGMCFCAFKKGSVIRHFVLDDIEFDPAFEMTIGKLRSDLNDVY